MKRHLIALATLTAGVTLASCAGQSMLLHPTPNELVMPGPDSFRVVMETTRGLFTLMIHRDWSPYGSDRFYSLVANGYYNEARFFRVVPGFVAQFGISGNPLVNVAWQNQHIPDDHMMRSNIRGTIAFGNDGPDSRAVQVFINLADNTRLDTAGARGFPPIGAVVDGMFVVDSLYSGYGEGPPRGKGPSQDSITVLGTPYLVRAFPRLDFIRTARITTVWGQARAITQIRGGDPFGGGRRGGGGG